MTKQEVCGPTPSSATNLKSINNRALFIPSLPFLSCRTCRRPVARTDIQSCS